MLFWDNIEKFKIKDLKTYAEKSEKVNCKHFIVVMRGEVTAMAKDAIIELETICSVLVEIFQEKELYINITNHELVPKHELLSIDEKQELLKR